MGKLKEICAIIIFGVFTICYAVSATPDTHIISQTCNDNKYGEYDPLASSITYVLNDVTAHTSGNGYNYYSKSPWDTNIAYAHGACNGVISAGDCDICMRSAYNAIQIACPLDIGARIQLGDCRIRYEIYPFTE